MKNNSDTRVTGKGRVYKLRCRACCAVLSCLAACMLTGCLSSKNNMSQLVILPYGTETDEFGRFVLPYGTEVREDGTIVLPYGAAGPEDMIPETKDLNSDAEICDLLENDPTEEATVYDETEVPSSVAAALGYATVTQDLPCVFIYTDDGKGITSRDEYHDCTVYTANDPSGTPIMGEHAGVRLRGNSTALYGDEKKVLTQQVPYRIKYDSKINMMGLNDGLERKSWVLLKYDWGGVMDRIMFSLGKVMLHDYLYCSDSVIVHAYVNGESKGLYILCEQNQTGDGRVEINEPSEGYEGTDIGYFLELDNYCEAPYAKVNYANAAVKDIYGTERRIEKAEYAVKSDIYSDRQTAFIEKYLNNVFRIVYEACENGKFYSLDGDNNLVAPDGIFTAEEACARVLDLDSAVDMYLMHEAGCSCDCGEGSFYMCVDFSGESRFDRLTFTAPWDFNWRADCGKDEYWAAAFRNDQFVNDYGDRSNPWFVILAKQDWFAARVAERWNTVRDEAYECLKAERRMLDRSVKDFDKVDKGTAGAAAYRRLDEIADRFGWYDSLYER